MSIDTSQILQPAAEPAQPAIPVQASPIPQQPAVQVAAAASGPTPAIAARALNDAVGGLGTDLGRDAGQNFAPYRRFILTGGTIAGLYALLLFGYLLGDWIGTGNTRAASMLLGLNSYATPLLAALVAYGAGLFTPTPRSK